MSIDTVQEVIREALSNDPIGYSTGHIDTQEAEKIVYAAEKSVKTGRNTPVTNGEIGQIADLFERRSLAPQPGQLLTCAIPEIPGYTMDDGAVEQCEGFFKSHLAPYGENEEPMRQMLLQVVDETDLGVPLQTPPNIKYLHDVTLRDARPACGTLDVAWVDSQKEQFYVSMVSDQMPPPQIPTWFGPFPLGEVKYPDPVEAVPLPENGVIGPDLAGKIVEVPMGQAATISLPGNATTGYMWQCVEMPKALGAIEETYRPDWQTLSGTIFNAPYLVGIGGEVPPGGTFLKLDQPITVDGQTFESIRIGGESMFADGQQISFSGVPKLRSWGGVETVGGIYLELTEAQVTLSGVVSHMPQFFGPGGEAPPGGTFLVLDQPIEMNGQTFSSVHLSYDYLYSVGQPLTTDGQLSVVNWGGVETAGGSFLRLEEQPPPVGTGGTYEARFTPGMFAVGQDLVVRFEERREWDPGDKASSFSVTIRTVAA